MTAAQGAPLSLGPHTVWPPVVLAPMAGVTNAAFRQLCREFGAGLYVSEMITSRAVVERSAKTMAMTGFGPQESPRSLQLYGVDPAVVAEATRILVGEGRVDHVDLNFGCPVPKVTRRGGGAALPWKRGLLRRIVAAAVHAAGPVPVTVKLRLGIDEDHLTYLDAGRIAQDEGAVMVALHGRTAAQHYSGLARWEPIGELAAALRVPVLGNGDIWEATDAAAMMRMTGCAGVVVGRGCLGRPWLFRDLVDVFTGRAPRPGPVLGEVAAMMRRHAHLLAAYLGEHHGIRDFRKHPAWYLKGYVVGAHTRRGLVQVDSLTELDDLLGELDHDQPFPPSAIGTPRGRTSATPRRVALPEGWLASRDDTAAWSLEPEPELVTSGG